MEILLRENSWLGIPLRGITSQCGTTIPDSSFYQAFYQEHQRRRLELPKGWTAYKLEISRWLETEFLQPLSSRRLRVLSLGVGTGIVEAQWIEKGYQVDLQECQRTSLSSIGDSYPDTRIHISDCRKLPCANNEYDLVTFIALDYTLDRHGYLSMLKEIRRILLPGGWGIGYCVSNLNLRLLLGHVKTKLGGNRSIGIPWGYARTPEEHLKNIKVSGMIPQTLFCLKREIGINIGRIFAIKTRKPRLPWSLFTNAQDVAFAFRKTIK